jgi:hypothetical protein
MGNSRPDNSIYARLKLNYGFITTYETMFLKQEKYPHEDRLMVWCFPVIKHGAFGGESVGIPSHEFPALQFGHGMVSFRESLL